jgi:hypothetical protein
MPIEPRRQSQCPAFGCQAGRSDIEGIDILESLPPRLSDPALFALITDILSVRRSVEDSASLRLRLIEAGSWDALFALAEQQGVTAPLIWALMQRSLLLPVPMTMPGAGAPTHSTTQILSFREEILRRRDRQREQLLALIAALNAADVVPLLLKGSRYLVAPAGGWCEARTMRDIDILVRGKDAPRAMDALTRQGYDSDPQSIPIEHHLPEMWREDLPSVVEIHTEALAYSAQKILSTDEVWQRGVHSSTDHGACLVLPSEWHLLHGLLHHQVSDRGYVRKLLPLQPLWEFAHLGGALTEAEWQDIAKHMEARGVSDILASFTVLAGELYGLICPAAVDVSPSARAHAQKTLVNARAPDWQRRGHFLADQFRYGFSVKTLAVRYGEKPWPQAVLHHLRFLLHRYRGRITKRLFGGR